jgi:hypothetical protein
LTDRPFWVDILTGKENRWHLSWILNFHN